MQLLVVWIDLLWKKKVKNMTQKIAEHKDRTITHLLFSLFRARAILN